MEEGLLAAWMRAHSKAQKKAITNMSIAKVAGDSRIQPITAIA